jgi:anti-sigma regulatory factor (Ser/Thr protein kinase)/ABC-type transporter Mla MlaB component
LICRVRHRLPIAVVDLVGTLDRSTVARAVVALRDCLAEAPTVLLADMSHLSVASGAALGPLIALVEDTRTWPQTAIGWCAASAAVRTLLSVYGTDRLPQLYPHVRAAMAVAVTVPVAPREALTLPAEAGAPATARGFVDRTCTQWKIPRVARLATLVASELVTNAVVHARTPSVLGLRLAGGSLHVSVRDGDPRPMHRPDPGASGAHDGDHGRGLLILDAMADEWGCLPTADGKVVWATIGLPPD